MCSNAELVGAPLPRRAMTSHPRASARMPGAWNAIFPQPLAAVPPDSRGGFAKSVRIAVEDLNEETKYDVAVRNERCCREVSRVEASRK